MKTVSKYATLRFAAMIRVSTQQQASAGGKSREFKVTAKSPMAADVDLAATGEIAAMPVALATDDAGAATPAGTRPFWRERVAEFLKQKVPGQAGARE